MKKFNVAGITFKMKTIPSLSMARPSGAVKFIAEPNNEKDKNAVGIWWEGAQIGYVPVASGLQKVCADKGVGIIAGYKYHHPDWKELGIPKWNDQHIGQLKSIEVGVDVEAEIESPVIGGRYMRVTQLLGYFNTGGTCDNLIRWAFGKGNTFEEYKEALDETAVAGTAMHSSIEEYFVDSKEVSLFCLPNGWDNFVKKYEPEFCYGEERFKDNELMVTGQPDFVGYINHKGRRVLAVLDWKSGKRTQLKHRIQIAIYAKNIVWQGEKPEVAVVVYFGSDAKQGFSVSVVDIESIENYYLATKHLKELMRLTNAPVDESKYL